MSDLKLYLETLESVHTRIGYAHDLEHFQAWAEGRGELDAASLAEYVAALRRTSAAATSINRRLSAVRSYLRWQAATGRAPAGVYAASQVVAGVKAPKKLPRPFTEAEVERLLDQADLSTFAGTRDYAFIQGALSTGARLDELLRLNVEDVNFEVGEAVVWGKGSKERVVFFDETALGALVAHLTLRASPKNGPLFANAEGGRVSRRWVQHMLTSYGARAGVSAHPHKLRRTFAVETLNASGGDIRSVQDFLGHADIRTTQRYTPLATAALRAKHRELAAKRGRTTPESVKQERVREEVQRGR